MQDEIYDRYYQAGRQELHAGLDRGIQRIGHSLAAAFNALHDINFAAPWRDGQAGQAQRPRRTRLIDHANCEGWAAPL